MGFPSMTDVEDFIKSNEIDVRAAADLRDSGPIVQRIVLSRGDLRSARNPSAALLARIRDAKVGVPGRMGPGMGFPGGPMMPYGFPGPPPMGFPPPGGYPPPPGDGNPGSSSGYPPPGYPGMYPGGGFFGGYPGGMYGGFPGQYPGYPPPPGAAASGQ